MRRGLRAWGFSLLGAGALAGPAPAVHHREVTVQGVRLAYREAGPEDAPVILLLHGFPNSSHYFRHLMPLLADRYHLLAPDLPGFGFSAAPPGFQYTFQGLTGTVEAFTEALHLRRYTLFVFDYGAPVGFRLAMAHPERVSALVTQNGNAYEEGLGPGWALWRAYWQAPTPAHREAMRALLQPERFRQLHLRGARDPGLVAPESWALDSALMAGREEAQLDLFLDYRSNVELYPAFQAYFRRAKPPFLVLWGRHDPVFLPAGAEAFRRDLPGAEVRFLEAGHFALDTESEAAAEAVRAFLGRVLPEASR